MVECWQVGTCDLAGNPLGTMLLPFESVFGPFVYVIFWGLILGILWIRTQSPMLVGLVGLAISGGLLSLDSPALEKAIYIGFALLGISAGIILFYMVSHRVTAGPK